MLAEAELVFGADVHVDALRGGVLRRARFQPGKGIFGQPVRPIGIIVELAVALTVVAGAGHAIETDVTEGLAELRLVHEIAVRISEGLGEVHDDAIADVVDPVIVHVSEHPPADIDAGGATGDARQ